MSKIRRLACTFLLKQKLLFGGFDKILPAITSFKITNIQHKGKCSRHFVIENTVAVVVKVKVKLRQVLNLTFVQLQFKQVSQPASQVARLGCQQNNPANY